MRFGELIKQKRIEKQLTQKELAKKIGLSAITRGSFVGMVEKGERFPSGKFLYKLCTVLKLDPLRCSRLINEEKAINLLNLLSQRDRKGVINILKQYGLPLDTQFKLYQLFDKFWAMQKKEHDYLTKELLWWFTEEILSNFAKIHGKLTEPLFTDLCAYAKLDPKAYNIDNPTDRAIFLFDFFMRLDGILFALIFGTEALICYYDYDEKDIEYWRGYHLIPNYKPNIELILKGSGFLTKLREGFIKLSQEKQTEEKKLPTRKLRL